MIVKKTKKIKKILDFFKKIVYDEFVIKI